MFSLRKLYDKIREYILNMKDVWEYSEHGQFGLLDAEIYNITRYPVKVEIIGPPRIGISRRADARDELHFPRKMFPECQDETCPFSRECANHATAGDFRLEDGLTPDLKLEKGRWMCSKNPLEHTGAVLTDGSLPYGAPYEIEEGE